MTSWFRSSRSLVRPASRLHLEILEDRTLLDAAAVLAAITTQRSWITYAPSTLEGDTSYPCAPTQEQLQADLVQLYDEGWRGLVTYTLLGNYSLIPQLAKNLPGGKKFDYVIAGIYHVNPADGPDCGFQDPHQEEFNNATSAAIAPFIDGYLVGNEGLQTGRYTLPQLQKEIADLKANANSMGKAMVTSEISDIYLNGAGGWTEEDKSAFRNLGDWWFPNMNFYCWDQGTRPTAPAEAWNNVGYGYGKLKEIADPLGKKVVIHESWYPTSGAEFASPANQKTYFETMAKGQSNWFKGPFYFVWGAAYDQFWNNNKEPCNQGGHWGLHSTRTDSASPQPRDVITQLKSYYTSTYGTTYLFTGSPAVGVPQGARALALAAPQQVRVLDGRSGELHLEFNAYSLDFSGQVRVAAGDITGDGLADLIVTPGQGLAGGSLLRIYDGATLRDGTVAEVASFRPFGTRYRGGVYAAAGFFDGDDHADLVISRRSPGGTMVYVLDGAAAANGLVTVDARFRPFGSYGGEVRLAVGDVNGDGRPDIVVGQASGGSRIKVISGMLGTVLTDFRAGGKRLPAGVWVSVGPFNDDGLAEIIVGLGHGAEGEIKVFAGAGLTPRHADLLSRQVVAAGRQGVAVHALDIDGNGDVEIVTVSGAAGNRQVGILDGTSLEELDYFYANHPLDVGRFVACANLG